MEWTDIKVGDKISWDVTDGASGTYREFSGTVVRFDPDGSLLAQDRYGAHFFVYPEEVTSVNGIDVQFD